MLEISCGHKVSILLCNTSSNSNDIVVVFRLFFLRSVNLQVSCSYSCSYFRDCDVRTEYMNEIDVSIYVCVIRKPLC
jgi:hypothetical protein